MSESESFAAVGFDLSDEEGTVDVETVLATVQEFCTEQLDDYLALADNPVVPHAVRSETEQTLYFEVPPSTWDHLATRLDLSVTEREAAELAHTLTVAEATSFDGEDASGLVVGKPETRRRADRVPADTVGALTRKGLTPAEVLDVWMVDRQGRPVDEWAEERGTTPETVEANLRAGRRKLGSSEDESGG